MGEVTSACCNPTTQLSELETVSPLPKQAIDPLPELDPLTLYEPPSPELEETLRIANSHREDQDRTSDHTKELNLWSIELKPVDSRRRWLYLRGETNSEHKLEGEVTLYFPNGEIFEGRMQNGQPTSGIFVFRAGCYYVGAIANTNAEGHGRFEDRSTAYIYTGNWSKSLPHHQGEEHYGNGDHYRGNLVYGAKFGEGSYRYADGRLYEGSFYFNQSDGQGSMTYPDGSRYDGHWKMGLYDGHGKFRWPNNEHYEGDYREGKRHGRGRYTFRNNSYYEGGWANGKQDGEGVICEGFDEITGLWEEGQFVS